VLLLARERVITTSKTGDFDTVVFFDRPENVEQVQLRIPGSLGFPGEFFSVVDMQDNEEPDESDAVEVLDGDAAAQDTIETHKQKNLLATRRQFIRTFPFDVINLDVERYFFIPSEEVPGKLVRALRKVLTWQKHPGLWAKKKYNIQEFDLMFTTKVGPNLANSEYRDMLIHILENNIQRESDLARLYNEKFNQQSVVELFESSYDTALKLAIPKSIVDIVQDEDWFVDSSEGLRVFQFQRQAPAHNYTMLHMVMTVRRPKKTLERRPISQKISVEAAKENLAVVRRIFQDTCADVDALVVAPLEGLLQQDLNELISYRRGIVEDGVLDM
jgi:hypothetical protein